MAAVAKIARPGLKKQPGLKYLIANLSCLVGPAIFFQRTKSAELHRQLWKHAWPTKARYQWFLLLFASLVCWYLYFFWAQLNTCLKSPAYQSLKSRGISSKRQLYDLLYLGLCCGARPTDYYIFELYRVDRARWLNYVFSQEQLTWHRVHSCRPDAVSGWLVNDKYALETALLEEGIATTTTLEVIPSESLPESNQVFQQ